MFKIWIKDGFRDFKIRIKDGFRDSKRRNYNVKKDLVKSNLGTNVILVLLEPCSKIINERIREDSS